MDHRNDPSGCCKGAPLDKGHKDTHIINRLWRYAWIYPLVAFVLSIVVLAVLGRTWTSLIVIVLLFACPAAIIWGVFTLGRDTKLEDQRRRRHLGASNERK